jgi:hypothetical protein
MRTQIFLTWGKIYSVATTSRGNLLVGSRSDTIRYYVLEEKTNHRQR